VGPSRALLGNHRVFMAWPKMDARLAAKHLARGFTLIEIAIVIVVIGLLVGGGLTAISPVIESARISETKQKIATVEAAILGYVIQNGCMPCPAQRGAAASGQTADSAAAVYTGCTTNGCVTNGEGLVPWVSLGLSQNDATDGWNRRFSYGVDPTRAVALSMQRDANGAFPNFASTIDIETLAGADQAYGSIVYVLLSHGQDGSFGESQSGAIGADRYGQAAGATGLGQHENGNFNDLDFADGNINAGNGVGYFDDIVVFKSFQPLILSCGSGSCGNPS
jgi:prepilin-type N-terminal cleavage/methylation domain-containing protein